MTLIDFNELRRRGIVANRTTLARWIATRGFPRPLHPGLNSARWDADEVDAWLEARRAERDTQAAS